jgi:Ca2+:H+ antiporter
MATAAAKSLLTWPTLTPVVAILALAGTWTREPGPLLVVLVALILGAAVLAAVHHAEVVAHRVGEPYGSLVLAVAVTVIEVALIVTLMISGGPGTEALARDTVFAAVMITTNGIVGLALLVGAIRHGLVSFNAEGTGAALATVTSLATLSLVLPNFTASEPGPVFSAGQLIFAAIASLALYGMFVLTQTVRHRETGVRAAGFPQSFVGVVIALLVLLPETLAAVRAARRDRIQISLNLALGSAMASIGLTIPVIAVASIWLEGPLTLGLGSTQMILLTLTVLVSVLTVVPGRATRLQGGVHLVLLAAFLFLSISP